MYEFVKGFNRLLIISLGIFVMSVNKADIIQCLILGKVFIR